MPILSERFLLFFLETQSLYVKFHKCWNYSHLSQLFRLLEGSEGKSTRKFSMERLTLLTST